MVRADDKQISADDLTFKKVVRHIFRYGFVEIADDILFALLVGIALGGVLYLVIPSDLMSNEYARCCPIPLWCWLVFPSIFARLRVLR